MLDLAPVLAAILKSAGSLAGATLAFIFLPPKTLGQFAQRGIFSVGSGLLFGGNVLDYLHWADTPRRSIAADAITAMLSWFVFGAAVRVIGKWMPSGK